MELYRMGVFAEQNTASSGILLENMEFSGVARVRNRVAALSSGEEHD